jgi:cyanate permease
MNVGNFGSSHCSANIYNLVGTENELLAIIIIIIIIIIINMNSIIKSAAKIIEELSQRYGESDAKQDEIQHTKA